MRVKTIKDIGLIIRARRRKLGMGQRALADRVGVSRQWIVEVEKGKPRVATDLLLRTLQTLDLELTVDLEKPSAAKAAGPSDGYGDGTGYSGGTGDGAGFGDGTGDGGSWDIDIDALIDKARGGDR